MGTKEKDNKQLFMDLLHCEREKDIKKIIEKYDMEHSEDWIAYGGMEGNHSIIGTQSSNPEKAFSEKVTNAIDALLMRKCIERGIDPKSKEAPASPQEALQRFYGIENGDPTKITKDQEKEIQEEICIFATSPGNKILNDLKFEDRQMNLMIWDQGEGQTPEKLKETVLSLVKGNKKGIAFTQGCFNQGGSGALKYCGNNGYCLVLSKRHNSIRQEKEDSNWGFTLIREEMRPEESNPIYTYYAPNGKIPSFEAEALPLLPRVITGQEAKDYLEYKGSCSAGLPYQRKVECGTMFKLYNYDMKNKGPLPSHIKFELAKVLYDTYLPIRMIDCRKNKFNNNIIFRGLQKFLDDDLKKTGENALIYEGFPIKNQFTVEGQCVEMTVYGFNKKKAGEKSEKNYLDNNQPIVFVLGQQIQGKLDSRVISNAGYGPIKNSLLIILKFPDISPVFRKDLFMTDRERLLEKKPKQEIQKKIREFLQNEPLIQEFCDDRMQMNMQSDDKDHKVAEDIVGKLFLQNAGIKNLLFPGGSIVGKAVGRHGISNPPKKEREKNRKEEVVLLDNPTYYIPDLKILDGHYIKETEVGKSFRISLKTDGPEDFFDRLENHGSIRLLYDGKEILDYSMTKLRGRINLIFSPVCAKKIGSHQMKIEISCPKLWKTEHEIEIIVKQEDDRKTISKEKPEKQAFALPELRRVRKENWLSDMDEKSALILQHYQGKSIYTVNLDNQSLQTVRSGCQNTAEQMYYEECFCYDLLLMAICLENDMKEQKKEDDEIEERIRQSTEDYAKAFWPIEQLSGNMRKAMLGE